MYTRKETTQYVVEGLLDGPELRGATKKYYNCTGRNYTRSMYASDKLAVAILAENEPQWEHILLERCSQPKQLLGIAVKTSTDALLEACKIKRHSEVLRTPYQLTLGSKWEHVSLRQCCSRTQPSGIVAKANNHRLRVAGKH